MGSTGTRARDGLEPADSDLTRAVDRPADPSDATGEWSDVPSGPTRPSPPAPSASRLEPGASVGYFGDYEIRRELGRGGMGVVYEARQVSLNRPVALKLIKAGLLAGDAELRRFQNEAEAVALLDHPGIVPAYEVGEHDGQQYLAMKLVRGESLAALPDRYRDDPRAAARLVAEAAEAVAHAHSRGILHRDLKPANILVDAEGRPHVTDFGLAKRLESDLEITASGAILGTPAYMAPEQATGHRGGVTTATDVYGLGSVLYALLTGRAPFGGDTVVETLDALRMQPPEPPTRLNARVPRDLETICLKCLEKDPRRRYASAQTLADDLRAWLDSRPIAARRIGPAERTWLWCRRRPAVAALAALAVVAIVGGVAATIAVQARANRALRSKNQELTQAYGREAKANADLAAANARVEQRYELAMDAIKTFHTGVSEDFLLKEPKFRDLRDRLLKSAGEFYERLGRDLGGASDAASRRAMLASTYELAELTEKLRPREEAIELHRRVLVGREALAAEPGAGTQEKLDAARSMHTLISLMKAGGSNPADLPALLARAVEFHERLAADHPEDPEVQDALAKILVLLGEQRRSIDNRRGEAERLFRRSLAILQGLSRRHPDATKYLAAQSSPIESLAYLRADEGKFLEAVALYRETIDVARTQLERSPGDIKLRIALAGRESLMSHWYSLAILPDRAAESARAAETIWETIVAEEPAVTEHRLRLASSRHALGLALTLANRLDEAEAVIRSSIELDEVLAAERPGDGSLRHQIANSHNTLGEVFLRLGRLAEAEGEWRAALGVLRALLAEHPADHDLRDSVALCLVNIGRVLLNSRPDRAEAELREAIVESTRSVAEQPAIMMYRLHLATARNYLVMSLQRQGRFEDAEGEQRASLAAWKEAAGIDPGNTFLRNMVATGHNNLADSVRALGRTADARDGYDRAIALRERLIEEEPSNPTYRSHLGWSLRRRGLARVDLGDLAGAADDARRALALWDGLPTRTGEEWFETACGHAALAGLAGRDGSGVPADAAIPDADAAIRLLGRSLGSGYRDAYSFLTEHGLDPLRDRPEFRLLLMDLALPADPFAR